MHTYRSHTCAELDLNSVGATVRLAGWVHRVRDHGGVLFIDLRDHYGVTQVLCDPDSPVFNELEKVRAEWVIRIDGIVKARDPKLVNPGIPTGKVEVFIRDMAVLGRAEDLPLPVFGDLDYPEETRLKYRFLDLRRESLHDNIMLRSRVISHIRKRMESQGFNEFQTPVITASSPEGARDFLVPSRLHPGKFYALPQAPQQFKQLIMVAGFDKYFQIAPCFRDEDPRADRSPADFYQLDMEMSFVEQQDVLDTIEPLLRGVMEEFGGGRPVNREWPQISCRDALLWYGTDKPDLRNPIRMQVVSPHFAGGGFGIFANILEQDGTEIRAIPAPGGGSRKFCDRMNAWAQGEGLPGMGYIFWRQRDAKVDSEEAERRLDKMSQINRSDFSSNSEYGAALWKAWFGDSAPGNYWPGVVEGLAEAKEQGDHARAELLMSLIKSGAEPAGPLARNIGPERTEAIRRQLGLQAGDAAFFLAGRPAQFEAIAGRARDVIGGELGLTDKERFEFCWIVDFPMYEADAETGRIDFSHNPFSMPQGGPEALDGNPLDILAYQYDLACNGYELVSGAIRNHRPDIMVKAFELAGYDRSEVETRFGGLLRAFTCGAPPHGGCAVGIDRLLMLLADEVNIREVIMFPMNQRAEDLMLGGPSEPANEQLRDLGLRVVKKD